MVLVQGRLCNELKPCFPSWLLFPSFTESNRYLREKISLDCNCYRPQTKLWKGNVFTSVCQEFYPREVYSSMHWADTPNPQTDTPLADTPPGRHLLLWADTPLGRHPHPDGHCSGRYASYWFQFVEYIVIMMNRNTLTIFHCQFSVHSTVWNPVVTQLNCFTLRNCFSP